MSRFEEYIQTHTTILIGPGIRLGQTAQGTIVPLPGHRICARLSCIEFPIAVWHYQQWHIGHSVSSKVPAGVQDRLAIQCKRIEQAESSKQDIRHAGEASKRKKSRIIIIWHYFLVAHPFATQRVDSNHGNSFAALYLFHSIEQIIPFTARNVLPATAAAENNTFNRKTIFPLSSFLSFSCFSTLLARHSHKYIVMRRDTQTTQRPKKN